MLAHGAGAGQKSPFMVQFARGMALAAHQRGDLRLPLHRGGPESAGPGARARTGVARGARRGQGRVLRAATRHRRQVDGRADGVTHRGAGLRRRRRPGVSRLPAPSAWQARAAPRRAPARDCEPMLFVQGTRDAFGTLDRNRASCCPRSSTPSCTRSPAAITPSRSQDGRATGSKQSWTSSPPGFSLRR